MMIFGSAKVVEYLEPLMSKELLCKFPDNSAFDFDYSQSSIWSPLVTRAYTNTPRDGDLDLDFLSPKKLDYEIANEGFSASKLASSVKTIKKKKKKNNGFAMSLSAMKMKKRTNKNSKKNLVSDLSPGCNPVTKKVWNKVLKAATKHFKRKKRESTAHARLSNSMASEAIW